jgi:hypothetical protein
MRFVALLVIGGLIVGAIAAGRRGHLTTRRSRTAMCPSPSRSPPVHLIAAFSGWPTAAEPSIEPLTMHNQYKETT